MLSTPANILSNYLHFPLTPTSLSRSLTQVIELQICHFSKDINNWTNMAYRLGSESIMWCLWKMQLRYILLRKVMTKIWHLIGDKFDYSLRRYSWDSGLQSFIFHWRSDKLTSIDNIKWKFRITCFVLFYVLNFNITSQLV